MAKSTDARCSVIIAYSVCSVIWSFLREAALRGPSELADIDSLVGDYTAAAYVLLRQSA